MVQIVKVRKGNADGSMIFTIPKSIANLMGIKIGTSLEVSQTDVDQLKIRVIK